MLLGKQNRKNNDNYCFCDGQPPKVYVESTDYYRTIQSAYAELMGMYPVHNTCCTTSDKVKIQNVPFKTRRKVDFGTNLIPQGFVQVPVYVHMSSSRFASYSGVATDGCPIAMEAEKLLEDRNAQYKQHFGLLSKLRTPLSQAFGLSQ